MLSGIRGVRSQLAEQFELDMVGRQVAGQSSSLPEQDRYDVQFHFVELPGLQQRLCCSGPMDRHVAVPGGRAGLPGALGYVGDVADAARRRVAGDGAGEDEAGTPSWWSPYHRPACSQVRRPAMTARVAISSVNT